MRKAKERMDGKANGTANVIFVGILFRWFLVQKKSEEKDRKTIMKKVGDGMISPKPLPVSKSFLEEPHEYSLSSRTALAEPTNSLVATEKQGHDRSCYPLVDLWR